ncbi:MAG: recombination-associated protein RdgC [Thermodesulfobacteriota bacterium]
MAATERSTLPTAAYPPLILEDSMSFFSSSANFVRYAVSGDMPERFWDMAAERIRALAFRDIDDTYDEKSVGWVSIHNMFDSDFAFSSYAAGDYIALALRIDERKVAPAVLKKCCMKEEERIKKEKQVPRLSKSHRQEIKENMQLMLQKKATPVPAVYDLVWNLADSTLLFFSTSIKAQELLETLFKETFGLTLTLQIPFLTALHLLDPGQQAALDRIAPEVFI